LKNHTQKNGKKKRKFKRRHWLLIDLTVVIIVIALLLYKPAGYKPVDAAWSGDKKGRVHPYLTQLSAKIYNDAQLEEPFELVILQEKINQVIARWSQASEGIILSAPSVLFVPGCVMLMATAQVKGVELIVTIELKPEIDQDRLLHLQVAKVKIGAMNITPLARVMAKRMYEERLMTTPIDTSAWQAKIAAALLNNEPFDPVFPVPDTRVKVRVQKIIIQKGQLIARLVPAS